MVLSGRGMYGAGVKINRPAAIDTGIIYFVTPVEREVHTVKERT
jgi:hypothetical protein